MVRGKQSLVAGGQDRSCFFKIFFHQIMAQQLKIPSHFVMHVLKRLTASRANLTSPSGGRWRVEIFKTADDVYLGDGWQGFVRDNLLRDLDFLLFKYDGGMCFTVLIFDKSGLERGMCHLEDATPGSGRGNNQRRPKVYPVESTNPQKKMPSRRWQGEESAGAAVKEEAKSFSSQFPFLRH